MKRPPVIDRAIARGRKPFAGPKAAQLVPLPRLAGPMPWIIAIMVALAVIAAAGGLTLHNMASNARAELAGGVTVQILEASTAERERQTRAAVAVLRRQPTVATIRQVPDSELEALLEPWLGVGADSETVPIPALIDVRLRGNSDERVLNRLRGSLIDAAPAARIDAQSSWLGPVFEALRSLEWLAATLAAFLGVTAAATVWLAVRSGIGTHADTIEIVHLLGGTNSQIARIFERSLGFDATLGGVLGTIAGLGAILFVAERFSRLGAGMMGGAGLDWTDWIAIGLIPLGSIAISIITARLTVLATLRKML